MSTVLLAGPALTAPAGQLTKARGIVAKFHTTAADELSFSLANLDVATTRETMGLHAQAALLVPLAADVHLLRDREPLFTGRLGRVQDDFGSTGHSRAYAAASTIGLLGRRIWHAEPSTVYNGVEQSVIVKALVDAAQALPGGNLGIDTSQLPSTGVTVSRTVTGRAVIEDELRTLAAGGAPTTGAPGFDLDVTPGWANRVLQLWAPQRGTDRGVVLEWRGGGRPRGGLLETLSRTWDPSGYANALGVSGGNVTTTSAFVATNPTSGASQIYTSTTTTPIPPVYTESPDLLTSGYGRVETALAYPDVNSATELAMTAAGQLATYASTKPTYTATLRKGAWAGPAHIWKGDVVTVRISSGPVAEETRLRVTDLTLTVDDDGVESVDLTLGQPAPSLLAAIASSFGRLATLERLS